VSESAEPDAPPPAAPEPEPTHPPVPTPPAEKTPVYNRSELKRKRRSEVDVLAKTVGIADPESFDNKAAVIDAMAARGAVVEPQPEPATA
jgi:hypothetical protein